MKFSEKMTLSFTLMFLIGGSLFWQRSFVAVEKATQNYYEKYNLEHRERDYSYLKPLYQNVGSVLLVLTILSSCVFVYVRFVKKGRLAGT